MISMRCNRAAGLAVAAGSTMFVGAGAALAQAVVYDNTLTPTGFYFGSLAANTNDSAEVGDQITLTGTERQVTEFQVLYNAPSPGTSDIRIRFYNCPIPGAANPGVAPVIYDSGPITGVSWIAGVNTLTVNPAAGAAIVPDQFVWTITFNNRTGSTDAVGPLLYNPPTVGTSADFFWGKDVPGFPGWVTLFFNGNPVANYASKVTAIAAPTGACCLPDASCTTNFNGAQCVANGGIYSGNGSACGPCAQGRCCLPNGQCVISGGAAACTAQFGAYGGNNTNCTTPCGTGRCCLPDGTCSTAYTSGGCAMQSGTYGGDGTNCSAACPQPAAALFNNDYTGPNPIPGVGVLVTGTSTASGIGAPPGTVWSELQVVGGCANNVNAYTAQPNFRVADNFTVPAGTNWNITQLVAYGYTVAASPNGGIYNLGATGANVQIWNGPPGAAGSTIVFGDTTTNRLASAMFANIYRTPATVAPVNATPGLTRAIVRLALNVNASFPPGTYWADWQYNGIVNAVPVTIVGSRGPATANGMQSANSGTTWAGVIDGGNPAACGTPPNPPQDFAFLLLGTAGGPPPCYANCDASTTPPVANVADFTCFLQKFAANDAYANCDGSTTPPVINVADFTCFLQKFAAGCP